MTSDIRINCIFTWSNNVNKKKKEKGKPFQSAANRISKRTSPRKNLQ